MKLTKQEREIRQVLIQVAKGELETHSPRLISYKELWEGYISDTNFGRGCRGKIVSIITKISSFDIAKGIPPLNELVVRKDTGEPGEPWESIRDYIKERSGSYPPYNSHQEAQQACWLYWGAKEGENEDDISVEEGVLQDKNVKFHSRNKSIIAERKKKDNYTCQACGYKLKVNDNYIIDCHHMFPMNSSDNRRVTRLSELVCLCPNCHRIAHTRKTPRSIIEIQEILNKS